MNELQKELERAEKQHPHWPKDIIHQVSIMNKEAGETIRAALNNMYENGKLEEVQKEVIQTGAMCLRILKNIEKLVIEEKDGQGELDIF
ncbi:hypothetical protein KAR91_87135 [Candidatus Pacearchaeota archaeon]|nr:hypothetical protein [Candidatus Pacearchaeota archaeon]